MFNFRLIAYHTSLIIFVHTRVFPEMKRLILCAALPLSLLTGCSSVSDHIPGWMKPYTPDVHQGNVVTSEMVDALHDGMTKNQVVFLLGTPTLRNLFHKEQWNYVYYLKPRFGETTIRKLEITFDEDGRVESFKSDEMPDETNADLAILGERARESTLKRQEDLKKERESLQSPQSETASEPVTENTPEPPAESAETGTSEDRAPKTFYTPTSIGPLAE